jgi:hypothetical protein
MQCMLVIGSTVLGGFLVERGKLLMAEGRLVSCRTGAPSRIACQRTTNIGIRRSNSVQSASSPEVAGSSWVARVAAMRNFAGLRFSATARYQDRPSRIAGSLQIPSPAKSLMEVVPVVKVSSRNYAPVAPRVNRTGRLRPHRRLLAISWARSLLAGIREADANIAKVAWSSLYLVDYANGRT